MDENVNNGNISMGTDISDYIEKTTSPQKTWVAKNIPYLNNFLSAQVGSNVTAYFVFPSGTETTKTGRLIAVGENYMILSDCDTKEKTACSTDMLKFVCIK